MWEQPKSSDTPLTYATLRKICPYRYRARPGEEELQPRLPRVSARGDKACRGTGGTVTICFLSVGAYLIGYQLFMRSRVGNNQSENVGLGLS